MDDGMEGADRPLVVIGIGASAGGLKALTKFFKGVPEDSGMAYVVIMHLSPNHESHLAELLQKEASIPVSQVTEQVTVEPNHVYVIPPVKRLDAKGNQLSLSDFTEPRGQRAPIDHFFQTMAEAYSEGAAVILSGGGADGSIGMGAVKESGGLILVQDPLEAEHAFMPRAAIATGLVDLVLPAGEMGQRLVEMKRKRDGLIPSDEVEAVDDSDESALSDIMTEIKTRTGHDFSAYKRATVLRRIHRRLLVTRQDDLRAYAGYMAANEGEADALMKDLLIGVTNFFRDKEAFEVLASDVIPELLKSKGPDESVRIWVAGCSTGEEAYSIAMLMEEACAKLDDPPDFQIFASDIDKPNLETARAGIFPEIIRADVSDDRLQRYFIFKNNNYKVVRSIRDRIIFAEHSIIKDPPFSRLDLISCRNLLIYLQREVQQAVFRTFHYALRDDGFLFLGNVESTEGSPGLFKEVNREHHIYHKKTGTDAASGLPMLYGRSHDPAPFKESTDRNQSSQEGPEGRHIRALEEKAPPSVLVDEDFVVVHLSETVGRYLRPQRGPLTHDLTALVLPEFKPELFTALFQAFKNDTSTVARPVRIQFDDSVRMVYLTVRPAPAMPNEHKYALVMFNESDLELDEADEEIHPDTSSEEARRYDEMLQLRHSLKEVVEEYDNAREEMKARNEELRSINEEYKSTVEELETSKEELQSLNEELETVNAELKVKVDEVTEAHADLGNLIDSSDIATLYLDKELKIRSVTPRISGRFDIRRSDTGIPVSHLQHPLLNGGLEARARTVLQEMESTEREVKDEHGKWFLERIRPYETVDGDIDGVIVTFVEISNLKAAEQALQDLNETLEARVANRTKQVRELAARLTMAEQRERRRISQALHDDLQQTLYGVRMKLNYMRKGLVAGEIDGLTEHATEAHKWIEGALETTRQLVVDLSPPILTSQNMEDALHWLAIQMEEMHDLSVVVEIKSNGTHWQPAEDIRVLLFQIIRELLFNVVKHAETDHALVMVDGHGDRLQIRVSDEGCGFDPEKVLDHEHEGEAFGLFSVRERLSLVGGKLDIESEAGAGTTVTLSVSVDGEGDGDE